MYLDSFELGWLLFFLGICPMFLSLCVLLLWRTYKRTCGAGLTLEESVRLQALLFYVKERLETAQREVPVPECFDVDSRALDDLTLFSKRLRSLDEKYALIF